MLLEREVAVAGWRQVAQGGGWARFEGGTLPEGGPDFCFPQAVWPEATRIEGESVNKLAGAILDLFLVSMRDERIDAEWPCVFATAAGLDGLGRRASAVEKAFRELLKKRLGRVARLALPDVPGGVGPVRGLFVLFTDFGEVWVSRDIVRGGQRRMADDDLAPSRSYLKVEEAYGVLGYEPQEGETVVDLGAAPGGWSYSAAKRGARVIAIDNGPMKGGALDHPLIDHRREDAFGFRPAPGETIDWLFCDLVEEPHHVARNLIGPWLLNGWCRSFVVILKFGRVDPIALLQEMTAPDSPFVTHTRNLRIRHLWHDREEFTLVGEVS